MANGTTAFAQLTFEDARKPVGPGGWRPGAGRPKGRTSVPHDERADFSPRTPQHTTLKLVEGLPKLREVRVAGLVRTQIALGHKADFRVTEYCIQHDHIHLITEADGAPALSRGLQGLQVRIARRLNRAWARHGDVFVDRYHSRALATPREVRNALRYVLNNERHHAHERGERLDPRWLDPFSSAAWFDGWASPATESTLPAALLDLPRPTAPARVWLLTTGWRRHGLIEHHEVPGEKRALRRRPHAPAAPRGAGRPFDPRLECW